MIKALPITSTLSYVLLIALGVSRPPLYAQVEYRAYPYYTIDSMQMMRRYVLLCSLNINGDMKITDTLEMLFGRGGIQCLVSGDSMIVVDQIFHTWAAPYSGQYFLWIGHFLIRDSRIIYEFSVRKELKSNHMPDPRIYRRNGKWIVECSQLPEGWLELLGN